MARLKIVNALLQTSIWGMKNDDGQSGADVRTQAENYHRRSNSPHMLHGLRHHESVDDDRF